MSKYNDILDLKVPDNISLRIQIYKTYFDKILDKVEKINIFR